MPKPITPLVGCDVLVLNTNRELLLIRRVDSNLWALPGGFNELGETPAACAVRECKEESGYDVNIDTLLGVFSSLNYEYVNYPWKENEIVHILLAGTVLSGSPAPSTESMEVRWFPVSALPALADGHERRINEGLRVLEERTMPRCE